LEESKFAELWVSHVRTIELDSELTDVSQPVLLEWSPLFHKSIYRPDEFIHLGGGAALVDSLAKGDQQVVAFCHPHLRLKGETTHII